MVLYKFTLFYPDLIEPHIAPTYTVTVDPNDDGWAIIRFHAGAPYEDIAFKIVNKDWSFNAQIIGRKLFTDYIDDVSGSYPDFPSLENLRGPIAVELSDRSGVPDFVQPGMQRGNGKNNDVVYVLSIGIMRYFGQLQCPKISKPIY